MLCSLPPLDPKYLPAAKRLGILRVWGRERVRERSATFATSFRLLGKPQEERGGGSSLPKKKSPPPARTQRLPQRRSLGYFGTRGRFGVVEKRKKPRKRLEACRWRDRGGVAPGASAGRLALRDLSPEATGLAAESEGGSSGPRAPRHACPSGLREKSSLTLGSECLPPPTRARDQKAPQPPAGSGRAAPPAGAKPAVRAPVPLASATGV